MRWLDVLREGLGLLVLSAVFTAFVVAVAALTDNL